MDGTESPLRSTDAKSTRRSRSCIIIGAGLAAAHYLSRRRWSVTVLEKNPQRIKPLAIVSQPWQHAEPLGGAYAFYRPGQWFSVRPTLQAPHGHVRFSGEHLADWQGFMEGAVITGFEAARKL